VLSRWPSRRLDDRRLLEVSSGAIVRNEDCGGFSGDRSSVFLNLGSRLDAKRKLLDTGGAKKVKHDHISINPVDDSLDFIVKARSSNRHINDDAMDARYDKIMRRRVLNFYIQQNVVIVRRWIAPMMSEPYYVMGG